MKVNEKGEFNSVLKECGVDPNSDNRDTKAMISLASIIWNHQQRKILSLIEHIEDVDFAKARLAEKVTNLK